MAKYSILTYRLRENLEAILCGTQTREQLNSFIAVCHTLARSFIASKATAGTLTTVYDLNTSDLAYDCIAELFHQDEYGKYLQLYSYFKGFPLARAKDEEILAHLRRLVFSKVNHGIFRLYSESDPSLAKILRNIKLAIHSLQNFVEIERFGESCIAPSLCDTLEHLPPADLKELERQFLPGTTGITFIPDLLAKLSLYLREQSGHSRILPIVSVGVLIRAVYIHTADGGLAAEHIDQDLVKADAKNIIMEVCENIRKRTAQKYVERGKIREELFVTYFQVIAETMMEKFIDNNGADGSLYELLERRIPGMTKVEYFDSHRNRLEYLLKLVEKETVKQLKKI